MHNKNYKYHILTLGCPKNTLDSENMSAILEKQGFIPACSPEETDIIIINTCCFIEQAREESINKILEIARYKEDYKYKIVVTGCLPQRYKDEIQKEIPEVNGWMGLEDLSHIGKVLREVMEDKEVKAYYNPAPPVYAPLPRKISTPSHYAYLKIAEGCNHTCSFCVIPSIRGKYRSRSMESLLEESRELARQGVRELILIAQDTTLYGVELYGKRKLAELLQRLTEIEELKWIRLMYAYPGSLGDDVLKVMAKEEKICKYLDIPLQHSHPEVLKKMGRPFQPDQMEGLIYKIRETIPEVTLRTAFITGHPGETPQRFQHLMDFIEKMKFYHVGVFTYSPEEETPSYKMKKVSRKESQKRRALLMELSAGVSKKLREEKIGKIIPAVVEENQKDHNEEGGTVMMNVVGDEITDIIRLPEKTRSIGRTIMDAPEIDGSLYILEDPIPPGTFINVKITDARPYDLIGKRED